jgi:hypothetical protein
MDEVSFVSSPCRQPKDLVSVAPFVACGFFEHFVARPVSGLSACSGLFVVVVRTWRPFGGGSGGSVSAVLCASCAAVGALSC